jgi:uncharacterized membrane protein
MTITAVAAFFVRSVGHGSLSPIHLFIPLTFFSVFSALWNARRGNIVGHKWAMLGLYFGGLLIAGSLTFSCGGEDLKFYGCVARCSASRASARARPLRVATA